MPFHFISFYNCIVPLEFLPWEIWATFPGESQLQQSHTTQATVHAKCFSVSIIQQTLTRTTGSLTCTQMLMHAAAHGGVLTPQESPHWKATLGEKSLATSGNQTCVSGVLVGCSTSGVTSPPQILNWTVCLHVWGWPWPIRWLMHYAWWRSVTSGSHEGNDSCSHCWYDLNGESPGWSDLLSVFCCCVLHTILSHSFLSLFQVPRRS